jgi:hypothetical protein
VNFTPKDQIILLAALEENQARRRAIWALEGLGPRFARLAAAGLLEQAASPIGKKGDGPGASFVGLTDPAGQRAVQLLRHITLDDLLAEHYPDVAASLSGPGAGVSRQGKRPA